MALGDKCTGPEAGTACYTVHSGPNLNLPFNKYSTPHEKDPPPIHRAENDIKRRVSTPCGYSSLRRMPTPFASALNKLLLCSLCSSVSVWVCVCVCVCVCLFFLGFLCSLPRFFWTSWKRAWALVKLFLYQPFFSISLYLITQIVKNLPVIQEIRVRSLCWEMPLEKEMATHFSILTWRIPWIEESGELQSMGSKRVIHGWVTNTLLTH